MSHEESCETKTLGGVRYTVSQAMVKRDKPKSFPVRVLGILGLLLGTPILVVYFPIWYLLMLNKSFSQRVASIIVPTFMPLMDKAFARVKMELMKNLHGRVLDVGCGGGDWLQYFGKAAHVTELEPNPFLIPKITARAEQFKVENPGVEVVVVNKFTHELDETKPYDYIILGNVMCEVPNQAQFVKDLDRVLKPGGKVVFQEHVRGHGVAGRFQDFFNVWWKVASDGCHCNRNTLACLETVPGWNFVHWTLEHDGPVILNPMILGIAEKAVFNTVAKF